MEVDGCIAAHLTLSDLSMNIPKNDVIEYAGRHGLYLSTRTCVKDIQDAILFHESKKHKCCTEGITFFRPCHTLERSKALHSEVHNMPGFKENTSSHSRTSYDFPPPPPSDTLKRRIVEDFCREIDRRLPLTDRESDSAPHQGGTKSLATAFTSCSIATGECATAAASRTVLT